MHVITGLSYAHQYTYTHPFSLRSLDKQAHDTYHDGAAKTWGGMSVSSINIVKHVTAW
jgi:hypothetical protein